MPKLFFKYGTMNSSKTANLLMTAHTYDSQNKKTVLMKPALDNRFGDDMIKSRAINGRIVDVNIQPTRFDFSDVLPTDCVLVDEAQFLSVKNIDGLRRLASNTTVICYGLRTDYKTHLFEGSKRLFEVADTIEEIKTSCQICNRKASINAKFIETSTGGKLIIRDGSDEPDLGANEKYQQMCWLCFSDTESNRKNPQSKVLIQFDGGSRGNPGISGAGAVICNSTGVELHSDSRFLGVNNTNNQSEYVGLIIGLELAKKHGYRNLEIQGDSKLVVNQINGVFECKSCNIIALYEQAKSLINDFDNVTLSHIYRDKNKRADELANKAMDDYQNNLKT
jgi:thymidine kinase